MWWQWPGFLWWTPVGNERKMTLGAIVVSKPVSMKRHAIDFIYFYDCPSDLLCYSIHEVFVRIHGILSQIWSLRTVRVFRFFGTSFKNNFQNVLQAYSTSHALWISPSETRSQMTTHYFRQEMSTNKQGYVKFIRFNRLQKASNWYLFSLPTLYWETHERSIWVILIVTSD